MKLFVSVTTLIFILFMGLVAFDCNGENLSFQQSQLKSNLGQYTCVVILNDTGGWFYHINIDEKTLIIQNNIPAINRNIAFADSVQASIIAGLVMNKLEKGIFPPSVRLSEIDSLNIYF